MAPLVQQDMTEGNSYGVSSTPAIFVNGRLISGAQPFEVFDQMIREELATQ
jgi:protein-disulfide isomerase